MKLNLDDVILVGRRYSEYQKMFHLETIDKTHRILDVASGVSSFGAEARQKGFDVKSCDRIYKLEPDAIQQKCKQDLDDTIDQIATIHDMYSWTFFKNPNDLKKQRESAYQLFLTDYKVHHEHYIFSEFPNSPFQENEFDLILISHFLFLYDEQFSYEFHKNVLKEIFRIAKKEIRIFPLHNLRGKPSKYVELLMNDKDFDTASFHIQKVDYEFIQGGYSMLQIKL